MIELLVQVQLGHWKHLLKNLIHLLSSSHLPDTLYCIIFISPSPTQMALSGGVNSETVYRMTPGGRGATTAWGEEDQGEVYMHSSFSYKVKTCIHLWPMHMRHHPLALQSQQNSHVASMVWKFSGVLYFYGATPHLGWSRWSAHIVRLSS